MPGESGLHRDFRSFKVANLTDHDDVGVLPQERSQASCEIQPDLIVHLDLVDSRKVELDGIFGGGKILRYLVEFRER